jgi:tetratricopeptide (TPR) repeat protein
VVHEVAYEGLSYRRRRELHARAGDAIEHLAGEDPEAVAEFLVEHFAISGNHPKAWHYALIAADRSRKAYANVDAAAHYRRALEAAAHLDRVTAGDQGRVWRQLGEVQDLAGDYEAARASFGRALQLQRTDPIASADLYLRRAEAWYGSGQMSNAKRNITLGRKLVGQADGAESRRALARLAAYEASVHAETGNPAAAMAAATAAAEMARRVGEDEALARAYGVLDWANFALGRDEPRHGGEAIEILERLGFLDRSAGIINNMGAFAFLEGKWDEAVEWYQQGVETSERCGNVVRAALTRANIAEVLVSQRRAAEALPLIEEAERTARASNAGYVLPFVRLQLARAALASGDTDRAAATLRELTAADPSDPELAVHLAEALLRAGHASEALAELDRLSEADATAHQSAIARLRAHALAADGRFDDASAVLHAGLRAAAERVDPYEEALVLESMAATRHRAGEDPDPAAARRLTELVDLLGIAT